MAQDIDVTVAICTWNRCELLDQTLERLTEMTAAVTVRWELLIVDNGSTDATPAVCNQFASRLPLRYVAEPLPGLSNARNRALAEARGSSILFTDDDVLVEPLWLESFATAVRTRTDFTVFGGPIRPWFPVAPRPALLEAFPALRVGFCGLEHGTDPRELHPDEPVFGANMGFRLDDIRAERFDPNFGLTHQGPIVGGEESDFIRRLRGQGRRVMWIPAMSLRHYVAPARMTLGYLKRYMIGRGAVVVKTQPLPGRTLGGVPLWLFRAVAASYARYWMHRASFREIAALQSLRDHCMFRGMLLEVLGVLK